jgi:hypothetical protein
MPDAFAQVGPEMSEPASNAFTVMPNNDTVVEQLIPSLWIGGGGAVAVRLKSGAPVTFAGAAAGTLLPVCADKVLAPGTAATSILGLY